MTPAEELKRLNRLIRQFEAVFKSTRDPQQRERVTRELRQLKVYKDRLESFHEFDPRELEEPDGPDELDAFPYLKLAVGASAEKDSPASGVNAEDYQDREIYQLALYLALFEGEFLALLSETRLKLDFRHSLERDSFYHRFESLRRLLGDIREYTSRLGDQTVQKHEEEMRMRGIRMNRNAILEAGKFFRNLIGFAGGLADDMAGSRSVCLNPDDLLRFDKLGGRRLLEGLSVQKAIGTLLEFSREVVEFLNVPQIESQEN